MCMYMYMYMSACVFFGLSKQVKCVKACNLMFYCIHFYNMYMKLNMCGLRGLPIDVMTFKLHKRYPTPKPNRSAFIHLF